MRSAPTLTAAADTLIDSHRWVTLKKINWSDPDGKHRVWESAERKTRGSSGIDGPLLLLMRVPR